MSLEAYYFKTVRRMQRNIVLVVCDSLRYDVFLKALSSCPILKKIVESGVLFSRAYSTSCWTKPAVASILTGLNIFEHKVRTPSDSLPKNIQTAAEILKEKGYFTLAVNENPYCTDPSLKKGFEIYVSHLSTLPKVFWKALYKITGKIFPKKFSKYLFFKAYEENVPAKKLIKIAIKMCKKHRKEQPVFLYIHLMDTHYPYQCSFKEYLNLKSFQEKKDKKQLEKAILNSLSEVNNALEKLLNFIKNELPHTTLIFLSDHGEAFFEHGGFGHGHMKGLYEETLRVPIVLWDDGKELKNGLVNDPVSIQDVFATILALAGIKYYETNSISLLDYLQHPPKHRTLIFGSGNSHPLNKRKGEEQIGALYEGVWKYILYLQSGKEELYNLLKDPEEKMNVLGKYPKIREKVRSIIAPLLETGKTETCYTYTEEELQRLKGLGYF